eukprot:TRINITY_DN11409_c0_g1_i2.p1 TRINITY_DN11409_c0_g1~~TRINITY_DN11409_c0_g1_i2.p1  ORF type:complete len:461 (-),score=109.89 TRINITY_DN11409_c0_g1_i2:68-1294(-)
MASLLRNASYAADANATGAIGGVDGRGLAEGSTTTSIDAPSLAGLEFQRSSEPVSSQNSADMEGQPPSERGGSSASATAAAVPEAAAAAAAVAAEEVPGGPSAASAAAEDSGGGGEVSSSSSPAPPPLAPRRDRPENRRRLSDESSGTIGRVVGEPDGASAQKAGSRSQRLPPAGRSTRRSAQVSLHNWNVVLLLGSLALLGLWFVDRGKCFEFSLPYLVAYNVACMRAPELLGQAVIASAGDASLYRSPAQATTAISFAYMGAMQAFIAILSWICGNMGSTYMFPRFLFVAQMYYYLFWYMMLMVVAPGGIEDPHFWVMVAMLNGSSLISNTGMAQQIGAALAHRKLVPDPPLKIVFDSKLAVQAPTRTNDNDAKCAAGQRRWGKMCGGVDTGGMAPFAPPRAPGAP